MSTYHVSGFLEPTFEVTRPAYDPQCYWPPPHKSLPTREALVLWVGLRRFGKLPILGRLAPQIIDPIHEAPRLTTRPRKRGRSSTTAEFLLIANANAKKILAERVRRSFSA
jgi:hypothetical protein